MWEILLDALKDSALMIPLLLVIYIGIEFVEFKYGHKIRDKVKAAGKAGPALGAAFGCVPQCGFSVVTTALYTKRVVTLGTLLAVYLSTSDEAIPIILSQPDKASVLLPLILTKVVIALLAGYTIDFVIRKRQVNSQPGTESYHEIHSEEEGHVHEEEAAHAEFSDDLDEKGCCGHSCTNDKLDFKEIVLHPIIHTLKVFFYIFLVSFIINFIIFEIGEDNLKNAFLSNSIFQPVLAGLVGLIPNCSASVAVTEIFLKGGISFGSVIAGLSAGAGLGLIVLFKENKNRKHTFKIMGLLYAVSVLAGILIQLVYG